MNLLESSIGITAGDDSSTFFGEFPDEDSVRITTETVEGTVEAIYRGPRSYCAKIALARHVHAAVIAQKEEQLLVGLPGGFPHGSICSKRLQDRMEREFPEAYDYVVNDLYDRSWGAFLEECAGLVCFTYQRSDNDWLIAPGSLRCRGRDEDPTAVRIADAFLSAVVEHRCRSELEAVCARALLGLFCRPPCAECLARDSGESESESGDGAFGALDLWEPLLHTLWRQRAEGLTVRLRDLDRPCQQLGMYVRIVCRWTELMGNVLLGKYVTVAALRVLLNESDVPWQTAAGEARERAPRGSLAVERGPDGKLVVAIAGTNFWGRIPGMLPQRMSRQPCKRCEKKKRKATNE